MPKSNEISFGDFFKLPNPGLRSYFDIVRRGQPDEYRTTFAKGKKVQEVLQEWKPTLDTLSDTWPTLVDFENDLASKVGPMSIMKPLAERMGDIDHYYEDISLPSEPLSHSAVAAVISEWNKARGLHLRTQWDTVHNMKLSTNSGSPYFTKRKNVVKDTLLCTAWEHDGKVWQQLDGKPWTGKWPWTQLYACTGKEWQACAVLGWRGQEGGPTDEDVKQRVVWMFPFAINVLELQCYQPLIEAAQRFNLVPAWVGMDAVDERVTRLFDTKAPDDLIVCTDFSKFDQHFNSSLQDAAEAIIAKIFTSKDPGSDIESWLNYVFPIKYCIPLAYDYGKVRYGQHGMGSGSGGTNADETLAHRALQFEAAINAGQKLNPNSQCLGDDGILSYPGITAEDVMHSYTAHGLEMNASKQYVSTQDCVYLRRWHHTRYRVDGVCAGVYSTYRALGRLCEQERYFDPDVWSKEMVALRQLSIIENVKYHPLRDQFAKFCMARDKYRLGIDIPGFLSDISAIAEEANELMPEFLGYTKSLGESDPSAGIDNWWIVNYLRNVK